MNRACPFFVLAALAAAPRPVHADFYSVEGRFQCLDKPGAVCFDAAPPRASLLSEPAQPAAGAVAAPVISPAPSQVAKTAPPALKIDIPADPIVAIARRIEIERPATGDLADLRRAADAGDGRALELLAWCSLHGIGIKEDAMEAYRLYGAAAAAAVPHAAENQHLVFEQNLTSAERERLLEMAASAGGTPGLPGNP